MQFDRDWVQRLSTDGARVIVRCGGRPITCYAVILEHRVSAGPKPVWRAVCMIDNHMDRRHMHRPHKQAASVPRP
jgi:hypothetical protein